MEPKIILHKELGLNPKIASCTQCGEPTNALLLLGHNNYVVTCTCGVQQLAPAKTVRCTACDRIATNCRELDEYEYNIPYGLCQTCDDRQKAVQQEVAAGGVFWRCTTCHSEGAIKKEHPLAIEVRTQMGIDAPDPCGVEINSCPVCQKDTEDV